MSDTKTLVWAIEPTFEESHREKRMREFILALKKTMDVKIQPVNVVAADYYITSEYFEPIDFDQLKNNVKQGCEDYLNEFFHGIEFEQPLIVENRYSSQGAEVSVFCEYIDKRNPDYVLLSTHGRSGWARTFLGSFAESVLMATKVPTFVLGPECAEVKALNSALMPVQLGESNQQFVEHFLDDHRLSFIEKLNLFHKISMVDIEAIAWAPSLYGLTDYRSEELVEKAFSTTEEYLKCFLDHPLSQKRLSYSISKRMESVGQVIVDEGKSFDLTIMRSESGTLEANILGSITREVVRKSTTPVIVYPVNFQS